VGLKLAADLDIELFFSRLERSLTERDAALKAYLTHPRGEVRQLFAAVAGAAAPVVIDLGAPAGGMAWAVQQVVANAGSALTVSNVAPNDTYGTSVAPLANGVIVNAGQVGSGANWPAGLYQLTAGAWYGGTADVADNMKLVAAGVATITTLFVAPVVNGTPSLRTVQFQLTAAAVFQVQAILAGGAGAVYKATLDVAPVSLAGAQSVNAGVFVGGIPSDIAHGLDTASLSAAGLTVPFNYQAGGKSLLARQGQHLYVVLQGTGTAGFGQWTASATVFEVPDTKEALNWL
jgi:hypothetical protein